jgi:beta-lactamase regulating signal transducer with metallopeptidase domain
MTTSTLAAWLLTYSVHSTILICGVWIASRLIRSAVTRDFLWKVALAGGLLTATLQLAMPTGPNAGDSTEQRPLLRPAGPLVVLDAELPLAVERGQQADVAAMHSVIPQQASLLRRDWRALLIASWALLASLLLLRLAAARWRLRRLLHGRREQSAGENRQILDRLRSAGGWIHPVRLSSSRAIRSPIAMLQWEIVVPEPGFESMSAQKRESILAHELAHIVRRDPLWLTFGELVKAVFFFQPLNRLAHRGMKQSAEFICDDAAVQQTGDRRTFAECLADLAESVGERAPVSVAAMSEGSSGLAARVCRVLRRDAPADRPLRLLTRAGIVVALFPLIVLFVPGAATAVARQAAPALSAPPSTTDIDKPFEVQSGDAPDKLNALLVQLGAMEPASESGATLSQPAVSAAPPEAATQPAAAQPRRSPLPPDAMTLDDVVLTREFDGPEGKTKVSFRAQWVEMTADTRWLRFTNPEGFVRVRQEPASGPLREIEILPSGNGVVRSYREAGVIKEWGDQAERAVASTFNREMAYASHSETAASEQFRKWEAKISLTGSRDHEPLAIEIESRGVRYRPRSGEVQLDADGFVRIEEKVGASHRTFTFDHRTVLWSGTFGGWSDEQRQSWLVGLLTAHTTLPRRAAERFAAAAVAGRI